MFYIKKKKIVFLFQTFFIFGHFKTLDHMHFKEKIISFSATNWCFLGFNRHFN